MTASLKERVTARTAPRPLEDDRAVNLTIPWRRIGLWALVILAVLGAWTVTTNTYSVLWQQHLSDRWVSVVERGEPLTEAVPGQPVAEISIPGLGIRRIVLEGVDRATLRKAPGHRPGTSLPGEIGNSVIHGHRLLWSSPFRGLGELNFGAPIYVRLADGTVRTYLVAGIFHMDPDDPDMLSEESAQPVLTLVTSDPAFRADRRLVIRAVMPPEAEA